MSTDEQTSFEVLFDADEKIMVNRLTGYPRLPNILEVMIAVRAHPDYYVEVPVIWDFRESNLREVDVVQMKLFQSSSAELENPTRRVPLAMVTERLTDYGILRQILGNLGWVDQSYQIFDSTEKAVSWIQTTRTDSV